MSSLYTPPLDDDAIAFDRDRFTRFTINYLVAWCLYRRDRWSDFRQIINSSSDKYLPQLFFTDGD